MNPLGPSRLRAPTARLAVGLFSVVLALGLGLPTRAAAQGEAPAGSAAPPASAPPPASARPPAPRPSVLPEGPAAPPSLPPTEAEQARGAPIVAIEFVGLRRLNREDQLARMQERPGMPFSPDALTRDVRELWNTGFFDDIEVDLERSDKGVLLRFQVRERPSIKAIEFSGNNEIENDKLTEAIDVKIGAVISYPALRKAIQKIRDQYAEKGYFLAEATFEVVPQRDGEVIVRFTVKEREQVSVRRVTFIGNHSIPEEQLREVLLTGNGGFFAFGSGGAFRQDAFDRDVFILSSLYYDRGFLSVQINAPRIMLTPDRSGIELAITINEGPQYRIRSLRIFERDADGKEVEPIGGRRHLREMVRARPGDVFNRTELAKDLQDVQTLYRDAGYANVKAEPATDIDQERNEVDVIVPIQRGPLVHFGRIEVRGNSKTRDKVIRRELEISEGQLFSETRLERSRRRVMSLGYFERVDISTEQNSGEPNVVNVNLEVGERPTGTFQVGAGFSSIESFIATAQVQQANLFGTGQSLSIQGQVSGLRQLINIRWFEPYFLDTNFSASVDLFDQLRIFNDFSQSSTGGSLTFGYPLVDPTVRAFVAYNLQQDKVSTETTGTFLGTASSVSVFQRLPLANLFNFGITSSVRPTLTYDTRDNRLFPTSGVFLSGSVELASAALGSRNEFIRYRTTGRFYYPLGANIVLKLNSESGVVTSPNEAGVPIFARFFLGGILDVRGFRLRTLGPRLPLNAALDPNSRPITNGANIGGNLMYYQNLELEFPIVQQVGVRGVIFTDLGNAWNLERLYCDAASGGSALTGLYAVNTPCFSFPGSLASLRTSWGVGLRWFSPLGPLRFEWGFPFKPLPYEETSVFEFTIGNFF
ncbi:MAG: outer membrane protein assembly factor BamA [Polyangiaceae bacterium]|nr:outer membrane protein assembly factor BamA [Polyangiaceae bacterium]